MIRPVEHCEICHIATAVNFIPLLETEPTSELETFLSKTGLQTAAHHNRLSTYSKGMRQKVGIAVALAKNAAVIFMDEPTSGLDPKATSEFTKTCKELAAEGKIIFMATHDIFNAVELATTIGIMKEGALQSITKNLPQAVATVTKELMDDRLAFQLPDAVKTVSSVSATGLYNHYNIRGINAS
ncbi:putative ABC transporter ATP-binding protein YdbJ [Nymphon striatum]|nr:putative ABC transporter ATP-binding protein YdbJ [Nymphon striatum]